MNPRDSSDAERRKAVAIIRKLAKDCGGGRNLRVGPEYMAAGVLKAMGKKAESLLADMGIIALGPGLESVPEASPDEVDRLPPVEPNRALADLLVGSLKPFVEGSTDTASAARVLLADPLVVTALRELIERLQHRPNGVSAPSLGDILRALTRNLQTGYLLGRTYYSPNPAIPIPDYVSGKNAGAFAEAVRGFEEERHRVRMAMYGGKRARQRTVFERYMRELGPLAADVAFTVMINALTPFTESGGPISVREVAWAINPLRYHAIVGDVIEAVRFLSRNNLVRILPEEDQCQLFSVLLPTDQLISDFTGNISAGEDRLDDIVGN